ncbi:hypothetical protein IAT38_006778 [Cryptococcus sp. DSM 104549]
MTSAAAELQKHHGLEGAPDPFPTLGGAAPTSSAKKVAPAASTPVDTSSEDAFPSLGASSAPATTITKPAVSLWASKPSTVNKAKAGNGAGGVGRVGVPSARSHPFAESFEIPLSELLQGKSAQEVLRKVQEQTGAVVESATTMRTGIKTFHVKAADQARLDKARKIIERGLRRPVTVLVEVPITTLGTIIGPKGASLKQITESTGCKIDIPRRDTLPAYEGKGNGDDDEEGEEEPQVGISVTGSSAACKDAKDQILGLIAHKISQTTVAIRTIPSAFYALVSARINDILAEKGGDAITGVTVPTPAVWKALEAQASSSGFEDDVPAAAEGEAPIKIRGDKEHVKAVVDEIIAQYEALAASFSQKKVSIPKRQHRFLIGPAAEEILEQTGSVVELPAVDDASDRVVIRGPPEGLAKAASLVFDKANAVSVEPLDLVALFRKATADPLAHATNVLRFLRAGKLREIADAHPGVQVFPPFPAAVANSGSVVVEILGEDSDEVSKVEEEITAAAKAVKPESIGEVEIDHLVHGLLTGKKGGKIGSFEQQFNVATVFPAVSELDNSTVLVVYTGEAQGGKAKEALAAAQEALGNIAKEIADIATKVLQVEKKWHRFIIGQGGSVLNALIGEDQLVSIKVGSSSHGHAASGTDENTVTIRGPRADVERVSTSVEQIVEDAKNDDIVNGYTAEFDVEKKHVPHLVGSAGAAINKLRETLGVKVNFDDAPEKEAKKGPKKAVVHCKIVGRKEAVEEAKKRLLAQIEKLEDETTDVLTIKRAIQPALIGAGGKYAIRLEDKYGVKLSFPRGERDAGANPDQVTIRGGKKGVAAAKAELLEAAAFETESRQEASFKVPTKAVAQIVGKGGSTINGIKDDTGAQIDIDKNGGEDGKTTITVRGDKKAIASAKEQVLAVVAELGDEITVELDIDPKYHRTLIGQGGGKLRELITNAGGPTEGYKQSGLVTFPKNGDENQDKVRLRGDSKVVNKIKAELEKQVAVLKETILIGVVVPASQHAGKIGRGGMALQDLQRKTGAVVHFPGSRQYGSFGEVENKEELEGADEGDIVKVSGTKEAVEKASELLKIVTERPPRSDSRQGRSTPDLASRTISIPSKYYHAIAEQQNLIRQIRSVGGFLTIPTPAPAKPSARPDANGNSLAAKTARIDLDAGDEAADGQGEWVIEENYKGAEEGELEWSVRAREDDLDKAVRVLEGALERAKAATHIGYLTGLPRSAFPRIIGSKGATISRMRVETGADIQVSKDDDLITITGDEDSVLQGREAILAIISRPSRENRERY